MRRPALAALALAAGAAVLQACAGPQPGGDEAAPVPAATSSPAAAARPPGDAAGFVPAAAGRAATRPVPAAFAGRSPRAARDLAGLTDGQLVAVMGEPDLRRTEDGNEAWLYRSPACLLDVFLEAERPGEEPRVVLASARPAGSAPIAEEACLRTLARARAGLRQPFQP
jgi:hypothetical protein